jgi:superfamily II DNA/RNA helicase
MMNRSPWRFRLSWYRNFWHTSVQSFLQNKNILEPTAIQRLTKEPVREGKNAILLAETGSGKTYSYLLPLVERCLEEGSRNTLILVPTFELRNQITSLITELDTIYPVSKYFQVSTPGRLTHRRYRSNLIKQSQTIVIDEADSLISGTTESLLSYFINDAIGIERKQIEPFQWLFVAATWPRHAAEIIHRRWKNIAILKSSQIHRPVDTLVEYYEYVVDDVHRKQRLIEILAGLGNESALIFVNTRESAEQLYKELRDLFPIDRIHNGVGGGTREEQEQRVQQFRKGLLPYLICTDSMSRGMDFKILYIIQYEFAMNAIDYLHRIGRTARVGLSGVVYHIVMPADEDLVKELRSARSTSLESIFSRKRSFRRRLLKQPLVL